MHYRSPGILIATSGGSLTDNRDCHHVYRNTITVKAEPLFSQRSIIYLFGVSRCTIENNTIYGTGASNEVGIHITDSGQGRGEYNTIVNNQINNVATPILDQGQHTIYTTKTAARHGGMPDWAWVLIGLAVVGFGGGAAYVISTRLAKKKRPA